MTLAFCDIQWSEVARLLRARMLTSDGRSATLRFHPPGDSERTVRIADNAGEVVLIEVVDVALTSVPLPDFGWRDPDLELTATDEMARRIGIALASGTPMPAEQPGDPTMSKPTYTVKMIEEESLGGPFVTLRIERNGEGLAEHFDNGEPEDQTFYRDWGWVKPALEQAYAFGLEDGRSEDTKP